MISAPAAPRCRRQLLVAIGRPRAPPPSVNGAGMTTCAQAMSEHGVMGGDQGVIAGGGACGATSGAAGALWGARAVRTRSPHLRRPSEACRERRPAPALHPREEGASLTPHFLLFRFSHFALGGGVAWSGSDIPEPGQVRAGSRGTWSEPVRSCPRGNKSRTGFTAGSDGSDRGGPRPTETLDRFRRVGARK